MKKQVVPYEGRLPLYLETNVMPQQENVRRKESYSSFGHSEDLVKKESTGWTSKEPFKNVAKEQRQSHTAPSTHYSKDYEASSTSTHTRETLWEVERGVITTSSQKEGRESLSPLIASYPTSKTGSLNDAEIERIHREALRSSMLIRWVSYPLTQSCGPEEQTWHDAMLIRRKAMIRKGRYPRWYMAGWDALQVVSLLWKISIARLSEVAQIISQLPK